MLNVCKVHKCFSTPAMKWLIAIISLGVKYDFFSIEWTRTSIQYFPNDLIDKKNNKRNFLVGRCPPEVFSKVYNDNRFWCLTFD